MGKLGIFMLTLIVMSQTMVAREIWAATGQQNTGQAEKNPNNRNNQDQVKVVELFAINRDDDHANLDLDKLLNDAQRYEILPAAADTANWVDEGDAYSLRRLFSKMNQNRMNDLARSQMKRSNLKAREDKDYSFVGQPMGSLLGSQYGSPYLAASKWATQKRLYDIFSASHPAGFDQRSQRGGGLRPYVPALYNTMDGANEILPAVNREKRRRCKADPNLGVKNPSFCDTDAYFGAADYSMRDVWDSAGR